LSRQHTTGIRSAAAISNTRAFLDARAILAADSTAPVLREFPLGPALGQCCGGATTVLFEPIRPPSLTVALFGAGHVGRAVAKLLGDLPC
jgi:xanthine dehydrogenase accessory factor